MSKQLRESSPTGGASRGLMVLLSTVVLLAVAAYALYRGGIIDVPSMSSEDLSRVIVVVASPDDSEAVVGQVIVVVDTTASPPTFESLSPDMQVTIPGTTYSTLGDAYPFGGGKGTAEALARARGEDPLPFVAIGPQALAEAVRASGGITLTLPTAMNVFDGERLFTFEAGEQTLTAEELEAVLKGAPYLTSRERAGLDEELGGALMPVLGGASQVLGSAETNLSDETLAQLERTLAVAGQ